MKNINLTSDVNKCHHCNEIDYITYKKNDIDIDESINISCFKCGNSDNIFEIENLEKVSYFCEDCKVLFGICECLHGEYSIDCIDDVNYVIVISIWKYRGVIYEGMPSFKNLQECLDLVKDIDFLVFRCGCIKNEGQVCSHSDEDPNFEIVCYCQKEKTYSEIKEEIESLKEEEWWDKLYKFVLTEDNMKTIIKIKLDIPYRYEDLEYDSKRNKTNIVLKNTIDTTEWFLEKELWDLICVFSDNLYDIDDECGSGGFIPRYYYDMKTAINNSKTEVIPNNKSNLKQVLVTKNDNIYYIIKPIINRCLEEINILSKKYYRYTDTEVDTAKVKKKLLHLLKFL